jgi:Putative member of DMT superfamily (DUF486)
MTIRLITARIVARLPRSGTPDPSAIHRRETDAALARAHSDRDAVRLQPVHDLRLVRPPALQGGAARACHRGELGIAFFEYCLAVPANRWGSAVYSAVELKTIQEVVTLVVFAGFSVLYLGEAFRWNHAVGFALIAGGAFFVFHRW